MGDYREAFVGIGVAKLKNAIAIAEGERGGEIRYLGEMDASDASMVRVVKRIAAKYDRIHFCYEAGRRASHLTSETDIRSYVRSAIHRHTWKEGPF
jgi:hypothetical protein